MATQLPDLDVDLIGVRDRQPVQIGPVTHPGHLLRRRQQRTAPPLHHEPQRRTATQAQQLGRGGVGRGGFGLDLSTGPSADLTVTAGTRRLIG